MRSINFRGDSEDNGNTYEGCLFIYNDFYYISKWSYGGDILGDIDDEFEKVIPETIEQQTDSGEWKSINEIKII